MCSVAQRWSLRRFITRPSERTILCLTFIICYRVLQKLVSILGAVTTDSEFTVRHQSRTSERMAHNRNPRGIYVKNTSGHAPPCAITHAHDSAGWCICSAPRAMLHACRLRMHVPSEATCAYLWRRGSIGIGATIELLLPC